MLGDFSALGLADGFSGTIPSNLGLMTQLQWLQLYGNALVGTVPSSLSSLTSLTIFDLCGNQLQGVVPAAITAISARRYCYF